MWLLAVRQDATVTPSTDNTIGLYFPPLNSCTWETTNPQTLGWNTNSINDLYSFLEQKNTRAFLVLKDGKIVIEKYFGNDILNRPFTTSGVWYWASAGKTLTSFLVGKAQEDGFLKLSDRSSLYLGRGLVFADCYLWRINGKSSTMVPTLQTVFPRALTPNAPADMIAAMGKNGQQLNIVPSKNLIVVRMGDSADGSAVAITLQDEIWEKLNGIIK